MTETANIHGTDEGNLTVVLPGYTYFIQVGDSIKIGSAADFKRRLHALQTAHEKTLNVLAVVPASIADEYETHQRFAHLRTRGEWFRADPELLDFIADLSKPKPVVFDPVIICRQLDAARRYHGACTPMGYRISNQIGRLRFRELVTGPHRKRLDAEIAKSADGMAKLAAV